LAAYKFKFDRDALIKAAVIAAFTGAAAALTVIQQAVPSLQLDPTLEAVVVIIIGAAITAISKAEKVAESATPVTPSAQ
jgi:hypothetical protein